MAQWGCGSETVIQPRCANTLSCIGRLANVMCLECRLVSYCSSDCQHAHWEYHEVHCRHPVRELDWEPEYFLHGRRPRFLDNDEFGNRSAGRNYFLWGTTPAVDIANINNNEGNGWEHELNLMFAASGDLRNLVRTINKLPMSFHQPINTVLNDIEPQVVIRNLLLLIIFADQGDGDPSELGLHLWYSSRLTRPMMNNIRYKIETRLNSIFDYIHTHEGTDESICATTVTVGLLQIRCELPRSYWKAIKQMLNFRIPVEEAGKLRQDVTCSAERQDFRERNLYAHHPRHRAGKLRWHKEGILVPFGGVDTDEFTEANFTLYEAREGCGEAWLLNDAQSPLQGWDYREVQYLTNTSSLSPEWDQYGSLYHYLLRQFRTFSDRISRGGVKIFMISGDAARVPKAVNNTSRFPNRFDRIDVSNLVDTPYLGVELTLSTFSPLLRSDTENPHACIVSLFLNYPAEAHPLVPPHPDVVKIVSELAGVAILDEPRAVADPKFVRAAEMMKYFHDYEGLFGKWKRMKGVAATAECLRVEERINHVVKERRPWGFKWLGRRNLLKLLREDLEARLMMGIGGWETVVEWVREKA